MSKEAQIAGIIIGSFGAFLMVIGAVLFARPPVWCDAGYDLVDTETFGEVCFDLDAPLEDSIRGPHTLNPAFVLGALLTGAVLAISGFASVALSRIH